MLIHSDCLEALRNLPDNSVDSVVTDPPYGLSFMGKKWDYDVPSVDIWQECLRVLKPGGHLLSFAGSRTYHRIACAIEDAGFEIRDQIMWVYGSGFPKSLDVGKAIDKMDAAVEQKKRRLRFTAWVRSTGVSSSQIDEATGTNMGGHYTTAASQPAIMTREHLEACRPLLGEIPEWVEAECDIRSIESKNFAEREVVGKTAGTSLAVAPGQNSPRPAVVMNLTVPATPEAKQWDGWGTALKPAHEPICVARKPISEPSIAANVLKWGTGAINIDGCRVGSDTNSYQPHQGRFPANLIHDGSDEATAGLGDAQRFFYCAKASKAERGDSNHHPTVKPIALMRYLVRLVTPPNGTVLDPFLGSGTTAIAAVLEGRDWIGIEREAEYCDIARARIAAAEPQQIEVAL